MSYDLVLAGQRLDHEMSMVHSFLQLADAWHEAVDADDAEDVVMRTREIAAFRARLCGVMLRSVAEVYRERGLGGAADTLADLSTKLGLTALQFAREHDLPWGRDVAPGETSA